MICTICVQAHATEMPATLNVAPQAVVIANTENVAKRKHFAKGVVDGKIGSRTATRPVG